MKSKKTLGDIVNVERRFQRSIRLDADWEQPAALQGYIFHQTARNAVQTTLAMANEGHGAFTWTGPYGGGKSSLALAFASCFSSDDKTRATAQTLLSGAIDEVPKSKSDWLVVLVSGRRGNPVSDIRERLGEAISSHPGKARTKKTKLTDPAGADVIDRLTRECEARPNGGVLLIVDELGKYLDAASDSAADIHFFQDLAEAANRSAGRLMVVGILHQAFENYADRLGAKIQDEWAKIQGRYVDVPLVTGTDEVVDLVGHAIQCEQLPSTRSKVSAQVAKLVAQRRPVTSKMLESSLDSVWPLHPATSILLGPISRRRFGQNERSVFGFLASHEPGSFQEFLRATSAQPESLFGPAELWDYLKLNLEPAIEASPDGHRWALAVEALNRIPPNAPTLCEQMLKSIAVIDLFGNGSGLVAEPDLLRAVHSDCSEQEFAEALELLEAKSAVVFRRHLNAYALFQGSDFDIDQEVGKALDRDSLVDAATLSELAAFKPVLAKRIHFQTGTPHWFEFGLAHLSEQSEFKNSVKMSSHCAGRFLLLLPSVDANDAEIGELLRGIWKHHNDDRPLVVGLPQNYEVINQLGREYVATKRVQNENPQLEGDVVARREVEARLALVQSKLEAALVAGIDAAAWQDEDDEYGTVSSLGSLASKLALETYSQGPTIHSELTNRQRPSSNTNAAVRGVLHAIAHKLGEEHLGFVGYPAERGLVTTVFEGTGLYEQSGDKWEFCDPRMSNSDRQAGFSGLWECADELLNSEEQVPFSLIYDKWEKPPFGLRKGLMALIATAYLCSRLKTTAIYVNGVFQPKITDLVMDYLLQDPSQVSLRGVSARNFSKSTFRTLSKNLSTLVGWVPESEPLPVAQAMVEFVFKLPNWTRKAHASIPEPHRTVRRVLLDADDPHQLFEVDLPQALKSTGANLGNSLWDSLEALRDAYPNMLSELRVTLLASLKVKGDEYGALRTRAAAIKGSAGDDLKLSGFVARLTDFKGTDEQIADICGLVTSTPVSTWHDLEPSRAAMQLAEYAYRFRRLELFGGTDDTPTQTALMVMAGIGDNEKSVVRRAQIAVDEVERLHPVIEQISYVLLEKALDQDQVLAVIAELSQRHIQSDGEDDVAVPILENGVEAG